PDAIHGEGLVVLSNHGSECWWGGRDNPSGCYWALYRLPPEGGPPTRLLPRAGVRRFNSCADLLVRGVAGPHAERLTQLTPRDAGQPGDEAPGEGAAALGDHFLARRTVEERRGVAARLVEVAGEGVGELLRHVGAH